jgi:hypothetical protein
VVAGSIAFGLFIGIMAIILGGIAWWPFNDYVWTNNWQPVYAWGTLILFLAVPLIGFLIWLIRRIIGVRSSSNYLGWIFGGLWALGWISVIMLVTSLGRDFRYSGENTSTIPVANVGNKMTVMVSQPVLEFTDRAWWVDNDVEGWNISSDTLKLSIVDFEIEKSPDSNYHVILVKRSRGRSSADARTRAEQIQYTVSGKDSILDMGNGFAISKDSKYRGQNIELIIQVPVGKKLRFDESVTRKLNPVEIKMNNRTGRLRRGIDIDIHDWFEYRANVDYVMTETGLVDPSRPEKTTTTPSPTGDYRYEDAIPASTGNIEEQRRKVEEEQRKLKEMEEKNRDTIRDNSKRESMDVEENDGEVAGSPVFSLIQVFN